MKQEDMKGKGYYEIKEIGNLVDYGMHIGGDDYFGKERCKGAGCGWGCGCCDGQQW